MPGVLTTYKWPPHPDIRQSTLPAATVPRCKPAKHISTMVLRG